MKRSFLHLILFAFFVISHTSYGQTNTQSNTVKNKKENNLLPKNNKDRNNQITQPEKVIVSAYIHDLQNKISPNNDYEFDIYIWFKWKNADLAPPENNLDFMNFESSGQMFLYKYYEKPIELPDGSLCQATHARGEYSRPKSLANYPFDRHKIVASFKDTVHETNTMIYIPDNPITTFNPKLASSGLSFEKSKLRIENFQYRKPFDDTLYDNSWNYSQFFYELPIHRAINSYFMKLFIPFGSVVICFPLILLLHPRRIKSRLSILIVILLIVITSQLITNQTLPDIPYITLMDKLYIGTYAFLITTAILLFYIFRLINLDQKERALRWNKKCITWFLAIYLTYHTTLIIQAILKG